jgi:hypothetical protein
MFSGDNRSGLRPRARKGKAPSRCRPEWSPRSSAPSQNLHGDVSARRVQTRAYRAPPGRVIPLHSGRPCPCYPGLADGQGCSAALRFNPAP